MTRRILMLVLAACMLSGCSAPAAETPPPEVKQYQATFLTLFDTVTTVLGYAESEEAFEKESQAVHDRLLVYHELFDIYHDYEGLVNLKTVNDNAGVAPVKVDPILMDLLLDCKEYYALTEGKVNVFFGGVLKLWHDARTDGVDHPDSAHLPDREALEAAASHRDPDAVLLDEEAGTVFITDPDLRIDVGAIAKGWSTQRVAEESPRGMLLSVGGNVCATGPKPTGKPWVVGVQSPDDSSTYVHTLTLDRGSVVTSGDYQRYYVVDGKRYHHIIDPDTLQPSARWRAVTVVCPDSGLADCLSTALFLMDEAQGQALLDKAGAEAMWMDGEGNRYYSTGFRDLIRS